MEKSLWVLATALDSGYFILSDLVAWADQQVIGLKSPPPWLLDLCLAKAKSDAISLLLVTWDRHMEAAGTTRPGYQSHDDLYLGFLYLRFERGDLSMAALLKFAGQYSDSRGCEIPCENFYLLLNEIDGGGPTIPSDEPLSDRVAKLFAPMTGVARQHVDLVLAREFNLRVGATTSSVSA
jgi:hypothetical protein